MVTKKKEEPVVQGPKLFETGVVSLDLHMGGGLPQSKLIELNGESCCGKTTIMLHVAKSIVKQGGKVVYFDIEDGIDMPMLKSIGTLDNYLGKSFFLEKVNLYSDLQKRIDYYFGKDSKDRTKPATRHDNTPDLIVVDSLAMLVPDASKEKDIESNVSNNMIAARYQTQLVKDVISDLGCVGTSVVFINHTVLKMKKAGFGNYIPSQDSAGGQMIKYGPDIRFYIGDTKEIKRIRKTILGDQEARMGATANIWTKKSRLAANGIKLPIKIIDARGVFNGHTLLFICQNQNWITALGGGWYTITKPLVKEDVKVQTTDRAEVWCQQNADVIIRTLKKMGLYTLTYDRPEELTMSDIVLGTSK